MRSGCVYLIYEIANFQPALEICAQLKRAHGLSPVLYSPYYLPDTAKYIEEAARLGIPYIYETTEHGADADVDAQLDAIYSAPKSRFAPNNAPSPRKMGIGVRLRNRISRWLMGDQYAQAEQWISYYQTRCHFAYSILERTNASVLLLPEDNIERDSTNWCWAIHSLGGRAIVISYASITPSEAAIAYFDNPDYIAQTFARHLFCKLYPKWKQKYKDRVMMRLPAPRIYALERLGLAAQDPWVVNTGNIDSIIVESQFMRELFGKHGIDSRKIMAIGHAGMDQLVQSMEQRDAIRQAWSQAHGHSVEKKVMLVAMPPNQYPSVTAAEYATYADLVRAWINALTTATGHFFIAVTPHPTLRDEDLQLFKDAGLLLLEGSAAQWIPACDVFVASVSTTIKWASACGKPVLNYDCYDYNYDDYVGIASIETFNNMPRFVELIGAYCSASTLSHATACAVESASHWGNLEGNSVVRLAEFIATPASSTRELTES